MDVADAGERRGRLWLVLAALVASSVLGHDARAQAPPQIVRWELAATVIDVGDPDGVFSDVRVGDAVRGRLLYEVDTQVYPSWLGIVAMTLENPRTGEDFEFVANGDSLLSSLASWFDAPEESADEGDHLFFVQGVLPPAGFSDIFPVLDVYFEGPPNVLSGENPLADFHFDDWPTAIVSFFDVFAVEISGHIFAEIYAFTPITTPLIPGDFDYDGDVDGADLVGWQREFGATDTFFADADGDLDADGADFLVWQRQIRPAAPAVTRVPEPHQYAFILAAGMLASMRRSWNRRPAAHIIRAPSGV